MPQQVTIEIARQAGACYGVERALKMAQEAAQSSHGPVYTLGPLIHNPRVVADLAASGVTALSSEEDAAEGSTLLLHTHGVTPQVEEAARAAGATVVDATCPYVKKCHRIAQRLADEGYQVIVVGEQGHPEVEGTVGHAPEALVIGSPDDLEGVALSRRVGIVVQTTQTEANLRGVVAALVGRVSELALFDTICDATSERQQAAAELAERADVMVVIGGRNSANTTHLSEICREHCAHTYHIEAPEELEASWFDATALVGITAGASTPQEHIEEVRIAVETLTGRVG